MDRQQEDTAASADMDRLRHLKLKIKTWEKEFAIKNDGRPPARQDISSNLKMAARYSEYQKLKKILRSEYSQPSQPDRAPISSTPCKPSSNNTSTPLNQSSNPFFFTPTTRPEVLGQLGSPSASAVRRLKWIAKGYVSPTPQKNGRVLGLFDKLPGSTPTPPKRTRDADDKALLAKLSDSAKKNTTSSQPILEDSDEEDGYTPLDPTTPSRKRRYEFQTPLAKKSRPNSNDPDPLATPAIFRQHSYSLELKETGSPISPDIQRFLPNRGMIGKMKPLSTLVKELREMQDKEEDPGADVLRELEQSELNLQQTDVGDNNSPNELTLEKTEGLATVVSAGDADGLAVRTTTKPSIYKKKGQKRQTRRVKIRPVRSATAKSMRDDLSDLETDESDKGGNEAPQTPLEVISDGQAASPDNDSDGGKCSNTSDISEDELSKMTSKNSKAATKPRQMKNNGRTSSPGAKKIAMVKADKHQNFTRMKMHHKGKRFKGKGRR
ncbi:DNA replication regulator sld2 [Orbilia ellipsospora]|uniref:DNA replication regulator SLD2 n=1 Tax=Orbilia ellipsospora TaxID=2528407 RepID=A0AAV9XQK4_9PEZI